jgi:hypothetical protein
MEQTLPISEAQLKLRDADIQMNLAIANIGDPDVFRSCLNSFISGCRSVIDVASVESEANAQLAAWCKAETKRIGAIPVVRFFWKQRNLTIHRQAVQPQSFSAPIWNMVVNGEKRPGKGTMSAWFFDSPGRYLPGDNGNVPRLCEQYFVIVKKFVHTWLSEKAKLENVVGNSRSP